MSEILQIRQESPGDPAVRRLIQALDDFHERLYPAESNHPLDLEALAAPEVSFFVARAGGQALGCAALRRDGESGEIKRLYVDPAARGQRLGQRLLAHIEAQARGQGLVCLRLETGIHQAAALALYRAAGYGERPPFGDYGPDPLSVFMEKQLD